MSILSLAACQQSVDPQISGGLKEVAYVIGNYEGEHGTISTITKVPKEICSSFTIQKDQCVDMSMLIPDDMHVNDLSQQATKDLYLAVSHPEEGNGIVVSMFNRSDNHLIGAVECVYGKQCVDK